jgi:uncharacterized circularly permuted ATP-grasp superfamily protein/uncharacterized alpha-E superfamily protein
MTQVASLAGGTNPLLSGYHRVVGSYDEAVDEQGRLRPHWHGLVNGLNALGVTELDRRWRQGLDQIARDGVTFNPYDVDSDPSRPWMLDPVPLVLTEQEWNPISQGLQQRARLYEALLRDLFGPQRLLQDKIIPPELYFAHPGVFPSYHGLVPADEKYLSLYAADLARGPTGVWSVTGDRTRAPFGLGYVLENRIITSRMLPGIFRRCRVHRLASFYAGLREGLRNLAHRSKDNPRIVLLTAGPSSRAYFEDAYLARYLGFILVEAGDLAVRDTRVMLKTLGGLLPVEVIFRRTDDEDCDPVELKVASAQGIAGLLESCRLKHVAMTNAAGSRIVESPVFLAYLPAICRHLLAEDLVLPSVATWWCGDPVSLKWITDRFDQLLIRSSFRQVDEAPIHVPTLSNEQKQKLLTEIRARPQAFVAQEIVTRSTTPIWTESGASAWRLALRAFVTMRDQQTTVLPGGLARVSPNPHVLDCTMTSGERSQDVWILAETPVQEITLLPQPGDNITLQRSGSDLPSRVADNLYWLGRYIERAEGTTRLLRVVFQLMLNESERDEPLRLLLRTLVDLGQLDPDYVISELGQRLPNVEDALPLAMFDTARDRSLLSSIHHANRLAACVPDRLNADMWRTIRNLDELCRIDPADPKPTLTQLTSLLDDILAKLLTFAGLVAECMTRTHGWRLLDLGMRIERASQISLLLESTLASVPNDEPLVMESVLQVCDSIMTYRSRYLSNMQMAPLLDLLVSDETNPRSLGFQVVRAMEHVDLLPRKEHQAVRNLEQMIALNIVSAVRLADVYELSHAGTGKRRVALIRLLQKFNELLPKLSDVVSSRYLIHAGLPRSFSDGS